MTAAAKSPNSEPKRPNSELHSPLATATKSARERQSAPAGPADTASSNSVLSTLANPRVLTTIVAVAIVANVAAFYFLRVRKPAPPPVKRNLEMVLGQFEYTRMNLRDKQLKHGQFVVTLHLAATLDNTKFHEVRDRDKEMQSAVEEAMRHLRASDYTDPRFTRLRNKLQEALNEELGFEGIDEVLVANVPDQPAADTANADASGLPSDATGQPASRDAQQAAATQDAQANDR